MDGYGYECCKYANYYAKQESQLKGIQLQLEKEDLLEIKAGESIPFNRYRTQLSCYIGYDCATRAIYIMQSGNYYIEWWVATESIMGGKDAFVAFSILSSQGHEIKAFSPNTLGQITGNGLIGLCASPALPTWLTLANITDGSIAYGQVPIKANLIIFQVAQH